MKASLIRFQLAGIAMLAVAFCACGGGNGGVDGAAATAASTVRLAARQGAEAKPGRVVRSALAVRRGSEDAEEPESAARRGVAVPEGSVAPGPAATAARASRARAEQVRVARARPVTEALQAAEDLEAAERAVRESPATEGRARAGVARVARIMTAASPTLRRRSPAPWTAVNVRPARGVPAEALGLECAPVTRSAAPTRNAPRRTRCAAARRAIRHHESASTRASAYASDVNRPVRS